MHIGICAGACNAVDGPKDKQDVKLFFAEALSVLPPVKNPAKAMSGGVALSVGKIIWRRAFSRPNSQAHTQKPFYNPSF